jgi:chromosome segregation ATPase
MQQLIKERDEARAEAETFSAQARDAEQNVIDMQQQLSAAKSSEGAWQKEIDKLKGDKSRAEKSEANALKLVKELETKLLTAQTAEKIAREELGKALANPEVSADVMEQLRAEAEAKAAEQVAGDLQKQLDAANAALAAEQEKTKSIEEKLVAAQKKADPEMVEFNVLAQKLRQDFNTMDGMRRKITVGDKEKGAKLLSFEKKLVTVWAAQLDMEVKA